MSASAEDQRLTIAIDGPAGAGKSTVAKIVASRLTYLYLDTGAMYRALALKALRIGTDPDDGAALTRLVHQTEIRLEHVLDGQLRVMLDGEDVTTEIRDPQVTRVAPRVSSPPEVRLHIVQLQRELAAAGGVVMDGRDIGSHVLPDADYKFFVTASLQKRAERRQKELADAGHLRSLPDIEQEIAVRDAQDRNKGIGALKQTPDAILIDTTDRSVEDVVEEILSHCRRG